MSDVPPSKRFKLQLDDDDEQEDLNLTTGAEAVGDAESDVDGSVNTSEEKVDAKDQDTAVTDPGPVDVIPIPGHVHIVEIDGIDEGTSQSASAEDGEVDAAVSFSDVGDNSDDEIPTSSSSSNPDSEEPGLETRSVPNIDIAARPSASADIDDLDDMDIDDFFDFSDDDSDDDTDDDDEDHADANANRPRAPGGDGLTTLHFDNGIQVTFTRNVMPASQYGGADRKLFFQIGDSHVTHRHDAEERATLVNFSGGDWMRIQLPENVPGRRTSVSPPRVSTMSTDLDLFPIFHVVKTFVLVELVSINFGG